MNIEDLLKKLKNKNKSKRSNERKKLKNTAITVKYEEIDNSTIIKKKRKLENNSQVTIFSKNTNQNFICKKSKSSLNSSLIEELINEDTDDSKTLVVEDNTIPVIDVTKRLVDDSKIDTSAVNSTCKLKDVPSKSTNNENMIDETKTCQNAIYFEINDGTLIILKKQSTIYIYGLATVSVLYGEVELLGYTINKDCDPVNVYSPRGSSFLYLKNSNNLNIDNEKSQIKNLISQSENYEHDISNLEIDLQSSIIFCKKLKDKSISFIEKHISQQIFPKFKNKSVLRCIFEPKGDEIHVGNEWDVIINQVNKSTKLMFCGGKGVGKSTLLRYSINKLLMKFKKLRVIDLDPGQSEFTIPGCISIIFVEKPIFGTNYTHLTTKTEKSIITSMNPVDESVKYVLRIRELFKDYECLEEIPTLINYMGYTGTLGLYIASAAIAIIRPTDIIQITSQHQQKNFTTQLTPKVVKKHAKLYNVQIGEMLNYNLHSIKSMSDNTDGWTLQARQVREMCVLSYFGRMVSSISNSILSDDVEIYEIDKSLIKIVNVDGIEIPPATVNANLVALSTSRDNNEPIFDCCGWGIVRGMDLKLNRLVLLTPEKIEVLQNVNYLVFVDVTLPPSIYMTSDGITGSIPYVNRGELMNFGQIPKRSYISVKK